VYTRWLNLNAADTASLTQLISTFRQSDVLKKTFTASPDSVRWKNLYQSGSPKQWILEIAAVNIVYIKIFNKFIEFRAYFYIDMRMDN